MSSSRGLSATRKSGAVNAILKKVTEYPSSLSTEAGLLRAAALNLGLGDVPQLSPLHQAGRSPARIMKSRSQQED